jgi:hypothetical protein
MAMFSCDVDCALIILQLNSPIHTVPFGSAITFLPNQKLAQKDCVESEPLDLTAQNWIA